MIRPIVFNVLGIPKPQPRPRAFARKMGNGKFSARVYDAGTAEGWKSQIAVEAIKHRPKQLIDGPIEVLLYFFMPRPKSHHKSSKPDRPLKDSAPIHPTGKPDCDNLAKAVLDCITQIGCFWRDDSQVVELTIVKAYADEYKPSRLEVCIKEV